MASASTNAIAAYYENHAFCPSCGSPVGTDTDKPVQVDVTRYDGNRARCTMCKWEGVVHELVSKQAAENLRADQ